MNNIKTSMNNIKTYSLFNEEIVPGDRDKIAIKSIKLATDSNMSDAKEFPSFKDAAYYFWTLSNKYSDAYYELEWQDGNKLDGVIDLEPRSFWSPTSKEAVNHEIRDIFKGPNPIGWHVATFNYNISHSDSSSVDPAWKKEATDVIKLYSLKDETEDKK